MAIGFEDLNGTVRVPDKGLSVQNNPKVRIANFGDGYSQRISYGLNNLKQSFTVNFNDRTKAEINAIVSFFEDKQGVESFEFTIPYSGDGVGDNETISERVIRVLCVNWNQTYTYDEFYSLSATFERVYETDAQQRS